MMQALPPLLVVHLWSCWWYTCGVVGGTLVDSTLVELLVVHLWCCWWYTCGLGLNPAGTAGGALELVPTIAFNNSRGKYNLWLTGCLDKLHIQSSSMQMKKWLAQKTLYTNAALLTRSLGKPSITPTQAKKLVTQGIDFHTLLLLRSRTSDTKDAFVASLKQKGVRSKPLREKLYRALSST